MSSCIVLTQHSVASMHTSDTSHPENRKQAGVCDHCGGLRQGVGRRDARTACGVRHRRRVLRLRGVAPRTAPPGGELQRDSWIHLEDVQDEY